MMDMIDAIRERLRFDIKKELQFNPGVGGEFLKNFKIPKKVRAVRRKKKIVVEKPIFRSPLKRNWHWRWHVVRAKRTLTNRKKVKTAVNLYARPVAMKVVFQWPNFISMAETKKVLHKTFPKLKRVSVLSQRPDNSTTHAWFIFSKPIDLTLTKRNIERKQSFSLKILRMEDSKTPTLQRLFSLKMPKKPRKSIYLTDMELQNDDFSACRAIWF